MGIAIGAMQVLALKALVGIIMKSGSFLKKLLALLLIIIKIAAIVFVLYLLSTVSLYHVIWAAGGMLIGLLAASASLMLRQKKTEKNEKLD